MWDSFFQPQWVLSIRILFLMSSQHLLLSGSPFGPALPFDAAEDSLIVLSLDTFSKLLIGLFSVLQPQVLPTFLGNGVSSLTIKVVSLITLIFFFNGSGCFGMNTGLGITSLNLLWDLEQVHYTHEISMFSSRKYGQKPWVSVFILSQTIYKKYLSGSEPLIFLQE